MSRTFLAAVVLALVAPLTVHAATSAASNTFRVALNHDECVQWYEANRAKVLNASNCRVLENRGAGEYNVQTNTPVGACQYVIKESRDQGTTKDGRKRTTYRITYVKNIRGRVADQELTISLTDVGGKTEIAMWISTTVSGRFVPVFAVRNVQDDCLSGCESYMIKNAR
jgi:hypothetical protein